MACQSDGFPLRSDEDRNFCHAVRLSQGSDTNATRGRFMIGRELPPDPPPKKGHCQGLGTEASVTRAMGPTPKLGCRQWLVGNEWQDWIRHVMTSVGLYLANWGQRP